MAKLRIRPRWSLPIASVIVVVAATAALAAVTWYPNTDTTHVVGGNYSWNYGTSLGITDNGSLQTVYATDKIPSKGWASDAGPFQGIYYVNSADGGATWSKVKRINKSTQHAERSSATAEGTCIYATWVSQVSYDSYSSADPRVLYFRSNCASGDPLLWNPILKLSSGTGRVDYPVVSAAGSNVYVVYTNSGTGKVTLKRSADNGATWATSTLATVTRKDFDDATEGFGAWPGICSDGTNVAALWMSNPAGKMVARISTDSGATFGSAVTLDSGDAGVNHGWGQCDALGDRIAFGWTTATDAKVAVWNSGVLGAPVSVATFSAGGTYKGGYGIAPALVGTSQIGVAWGDCRTSGCDYFSNTDRVDLSWSESTDNGATWSARTLLGTSSVTTKRINDYPSVLYGDATTRYVLYNGWNANFTNYRLYLQVGTGS